jgi:Ca2+-binding RTX toxin-like protein
MLNSGGGNDAITVNLSAATDGLFALNTDVGDDSVFAGASTLPQIIFGGGGSDHIEGGQGADVIFGDFGRLDYRDGDGKLITRFGIGLAERNVLSRGESDTTQLDVPFNQTNGINLPPILIISRGSAGGNDQLIGNSGRDVIIGGVGSDVISGDGSATAAGDILVGDNARVDLVGGNITTVRTTDTANAPGSGDEIHGDGGPDVILAGVGGDTVDAGAGADIVLADNGSVDWGLNGNPIDIDRVTTTDALLGGNDIVSGGDDNDILIGGAGSDTVSGNSGNDLILGDHAAITGNVDPAFLPLAQAGADPFIFTSINTRATDGGAGDHLFGNDGDDILLGQQGDDYIEGNAGSDDIIGGHNVSGSGTGTPAQASDGSDIIDGGSGEDFIAGDNATILRRSDRISPLARGLNGSALFDANGNAQVGAATSLPAVQAGAPTLRDVILLDHSSTTPANVHGAGDFIAGGADNDFIWGELGDDTVQGDSSVADTVNPVADPSNPAHDPSTARFTDGDDYIEGNAGNDLIYGDLGQDDLIG